MIFVLDTNVLWKMAGIVRLATAAKQGGHSVVVPALVHAERLAQVRREQRQQGKTFNIEFVNTFLRTHELQVVPFDKALAERCADALAERYPEKEHWRDARRARCASRFQMVQEETGEPCPATIDWYLQAPYGSAPFVFVTLDGGSEFSGTGAVNLDRAILIAEKP